MAPTAGSLFRRTMRILKELSFLRTVQCIILQKIFSAEGIQDSSLNPRVRALTSLPMGPRSGSPSQALSFSSNSKSEPIKLIPQDSLIQVGYPDLSLRPLDIETTAFHRAYIRKLKQICNERRNLDLKLYQQTVKINMIILEGSGNQ